MNLLFFTFDQTQQYHVGTLCKKNKLQDKDFADQNDNELPTKKLCYTNNFSSILNHFKMNFSKNLLKERFSEKNVCLCSPLEDEYEVIDELYMYIDAAFDDKITKNQFIDLVNNDYAEIEGNVHHLKVLKLKKTDKKIIGLVHMFFSFNTFQEKSLVCELEGLAVEENYRRQGFGQLLTEYAIQQALVNKADSIVTTSSHAAAPLYLKLNFKHLNENCNQEEWNKKSKEEKRKIGQEVFIVEDELRLKRELTNLTLSTQECNLNITNFPDSKMSLNFLLN